MNETPQPEDTGLLDAATDVKTPLFARLRNWLGTSFGCTVWEFFILVTVSSYFLFFGLVPWFGGAQLGLVGAGGGYYNPADPEQP